MPDSFNSVSLILNIQSAKYIYCKVIFKYSYNYSEKIVLSLLKEIIT